MQIPTTQVPINPANLPLERLADSPALTEAQKVAEATRQFESVLLKQILQEAQKPVFESKFVSNNVTSGIYQDMVTTQMADSISSSGHFGLAQHLQQQLSRHLPVIDQAAKPETKP